MDKTAYIIYNVHTLKLFNSGAFRDRSYDTESAAKGALTRAIRAGKIKEGDYKVTTLSNFNNDIDHYVETTNLMSGKPCKIKKSMLGTCCDPATERYWSM